MLHRDFNHLRPTCKKLQKICNQVLHAPLGLLRGDISNAYGVPDMTKTTRIAPGIYSLNHKGMTFEIEQYEDGLWHTFEVRETYREYMQSYVTKRAAIADIVEHA